MTFAAKSDQKVSQKLHNWNKYISSIAFENLFFLLFPLFMPYIKLSHQEQNIKDQLDFALFTLSLCHIDLGEIPLPFFQK